MWICHHIHFIHHLIGVLFLQHLFFPLSGELLSFLPSKRKPQIQTRTTLAMEARPLCQLYSGTSLLSLPPPSMHIHTNVHMHACDAFLYGIVLIFRWSSDIDLQ